MYTMTAYIGSLVKLVRLPRLTGSVAVTSQVLLRICFLPELPLQAEFEQFLPRMVPYNNARHSFGV